MYNLVIALQLHISPISVCLSGSRYRNVFCNWVGGQACIQYIYFFFLSSVGWRSNGWTVFLHTFFFLLGFVNLFWMSLSSFVNQRRLAKLRHSNTTCSFQFIFCKKIWSGNPEWLFFFKSQRELWIKIPKVSLVTRSYTFLSLTEKLWELPVSVPTKQARLWRK